jgi:hypothetical protein
MGDRQPERNQTDSDPEVSLTSHVQNVGGAFTAWQG